MQIHPPEFTVANDRWTASAVIESASGQRQTLWYRGACSAAVAVSRQSDPFVVASVFLAMRRGEPLRIAGPVSPSLLGNLEEFIAAWSMLKPASYRRIAIEADTLREPPAARTGSAVMGFSAGVDACFTAWRHTQDRAGFQRLPLAAGVLVHGFDIPLDQPDMFQGAAARARALLESVGLECLTVATNLRQFTGEWSDTHAAALASCLHLLQPGFATGVISGSYPYEDRVFVHGSCPLTDRLLGSRRFPIVHDAAQAGRQAKIRDLGHWPEVRQHLRVCWQGAQKDRNCGRCHKCVNAILNFRIAGHGALPAFQPEATPAQIARVPHHTDTVIGISRRTLADARRAGYHDPGLAALRRAVRRRWLQPAWWRYRLGGWRDRLRGRLVPALKRHWRRTSLPLPPARILPLTVDNGGPDPGARHGRGEPGSRR